MLKKDVLRFFGGAVAAAKVLGVKHQAVSQWKDVVPERIAWRAQKASRGKLKVDQSAYA